MSTSDGRVYDLKASRADLVAKMREASKSHAPIHLVLQGDQVTSITPLTATEALAYSDFLDGPDAISPALPSYLDALRSDTASVSEAFGYQATNLDSFASTLPLFGMLKNLRSSSQCYQRAHYWARQMWSGRSVNSMKVFLFFTRKFVREHKYKWWFHVAPFVYAKDEEVVLDPEFLGDPKTMHDWTDFFMMDRRFVRPPLYNSPDCTAVSSYSEYEKYQDVQLCFTIKVPMYYYQPRDLEKLAEEGVRVDYWREWDIKHSKRAEGWF